MRSGPDAHHRTALVNIRSLTVQPLFSVRALT